MDTDVVWGRTSADPGLIISDRLYNFTLGTVLAWGFLVNYLMVSSIDPVWLMSTVPPIAMIIGYFVSCFAGIMIYQKSDNPWISFIGYNMIVVPIGVLLVPFLYRFDPNVIHRAVAATGAVTVGMMMLSSAAPKFFLSIGRTLFIALILAIIAQFVMYLMGSYKPGLFDGIFVVIFSGYIGYDWARANAIPKTFDNAVDSAASLYLDIINLFIRLVSILNRR
jgi:FtsH-binding integral membrane protein